MVVRLELWAGAEIGQRKFRKIYKVTDDNSGFFSAGIAITEKIQME